jgi:hypothetical protein
MLFCHPLLAQEREWQVDSLPANSSVSKTDSQQVYEVLLKMLDRWNAHDIDAYLDVYWKSPELLVVVNSEQFNGWQQLHDACICRVRPHDLDFVTVEIELGRRSHSAIGFDIGIWRVFRHHEFLPAEMIAICRFSKFDLSRQYEKSMLEILSGITMQHRGIH